MPGPVFLEDDRIELRTPEEDDVPFLQRWVNHPDVRRHVGLFRTPYSEGEYEEEIYEQFDTSEDGATLLVCPKDQHAAGVDWTTLRNDGGEVAVPGEDDASGDTNGDAHGTPTPVGSAQLYPIKDDQGWANLAYWVAPPAQGNGYATAAGSLLVEYAFRELGLHRLSAMALAPNEGSVRVLEKLGFTHEGTQREVDFADGEYVDQHFYGLLRREWQGDREADT